jgi:Zn-dependent peptidase ImmA (M78 family)
LQLGIRPNDWTLEMICALKSKFNVSAEALALRLESLGLIAELLRQKIRDELRGYYRLHPQAMEPTPCLSSLNLNLRTSLLELEVARRERNR